jgi:hypothetical protein
VKFNIPQIWSPQKCLYRSEEDAWYYQGPAKGKAIYIIKDAVPCPNVGDLTFNPYKRTNSHWMIEVQQVNTA